MGGTINSIIFAFGVAMMKTQTGDKGPAKYFIKELDITCKKEGNC